MPFDFDSIIPRRGTDSVKYDRLPADVIPLSTADMDFTAPPAVLDALAARVRHGVFGYSDAVGDDYFQVLAAWYTTRHNWTPRAEWLIKTPGVIFALAAAVRALTQPEDGVLILEPVYPPFANVIKSNGRRLVVSRLLDENGRYAMDFPDIEGKFRDDRVKMCIFCNPHNPVGRVWTAPELTALGELCVKYGVKLVSDDIHADFTYPGHRHLTFAALRPEFSRLTVTCTAPSKTFNLAGMQLSNIFIEDEAMRRAFRREVELCSFHHPNVMGMIACRAAYAQGGPWLDALLLYLQGNLDFLRGFLQENLPQVHLVEPEGCYIVWLDCRELGLSEEELNTFLLEKARLQLVPGTAFGAGGEGFQRLNLAYPRSILREGLERWANAWQQR